MKSDKLDFSYFNSFDELSESVPFKMISSFLGDSLTLDVYVHRIESNKFHFKFISFVKCSRGDVALPEFDFIASSLLKDELCLFLSDCYSTSLSISFE